MSFYKWGRTVGEFTKRYRDEHSLTQGDLGEKIHVHPQYVSNIERGSHKGAIAFAKAFAKILPRPQADHVMNLVVDERLAILLEQNKQ